MYYVFFKGVIMPLPKGIYNLFMILFYFTFKQLMKKCIFFSNENNAFFHAMMLTKKVYIKLIFPLIV